MTRFSGKQRQMAYAAVRRCRTYPAASGLTENEEAILVLADEIERVRAGDVTVEPIATDRILAEIAGKRARQVAVHGYEPAHDDEHAAGELARAAIAYIQGAYATELGLTDDELLVFWPFDDALPNLEQPRRELLLNSAALIVAEIERLDRREGK